MCITILTLLRTVLYKKTATFKATSIYDFRNTHSYTLAF